MYDYICENINFSGIYKKRLKKITTPDMQLQLYNSLPDTNEFAFFDGLIE
jgi:hypothetical protein